MLLRKIQWPILGFFLVILGGTTAYHEIEGWSWLDSLWMVVITMTTIGYGEIHPLSEHGRIFTMGVIVVGVGLGGYSVTQFTRYVVEGELARELGRRRKVRTMRQLKDHFIVVGCGRLGREVVIGLRHRGRTVVAIDPRPEALEHLGDLAMTIVSDGSHDEILMQAALDRAQGIAVATGSEALNIFITLSARQLNPKLFILARVDEPTSASKAIRAGANGVINPYSLSGARMAQGLVNPHAAQLMDKAMERTHGEFEIEDILIGDESEYQGALSALNIPEKHKVLVVAIRKAGGQLVTATDRSTELRAGDVAIVAGRRADIVAFSQAAKGHRAEE